MLCKCVLVQKSDSVFIIRVLIVAEVGIKLGSMTGKLASELLILKDCYSDQIR